MLLISEEKNIIILTVSELNFSVRELLESTFGNATVKGEISNLAMPRSGHIYFTLKDNAAQVRCAMFRNQVSKLANPVQEGDEVVIKGQVSLYPERGDYQIIVHHLEPWGIGQLQQAFEALKQKLKDEGLFEHELKQEIPRYPLHIALVTSPTGAALQDMLNVIGRRWPLAKLSVCDTLVQGAQAIPNLLKALTLAESLKPDVIICARGGGSIEDLWAFNDEKVARKIFACKIPIVTGIGHETDFTIADFVADLRAPTPSSAAEAVTPDRYELNQILEHKCAQLISSIMKYLYHKNMHLDHLIKRLKHPSSQIKEKQEKLKYLVYKINQHIKMLIRNYKHQLNTYYEKLNILNPHHILERGYSISYDKNQKIIKSIETLQPGDIITTQVANGIIQSTVN